MSKLFETVNLHGLELANRIVMAPMTRARASADGVLPELAVEYYAQRASAGLIITEATAISKQGSGYPNIPGIWNETQVEAWKKITGAVHRKGGKVFIQLFHTGRIAHSSLTGDQPVSSTDHLPEGQVMAKDYSMQPYETPKILASEDVAAIVEQFRRAAVNAKEAGFDGIEIHAANGYLLDQFLRDGTNSRTDSYGGSVENRARLLAEVVAATIGAFGEHRVGVRLSPSSGFNSMRDSDPLATFTKTAEILSACKLAYLHLVEPVSGDREVTAAVRKVYKNTLMANEGLTADSAEDLLRAGAVDLVSFGKPYIANPDLAERFKKKLPLAQPDPATMYGGDARGYTDYPAYPG